jgi:hypothetical protein
LTGPAGGSAFATANFLTATAEGACRSTAAALPTGGVLPKTSSALEAVSNLRD